MVGIKELFNNGENVLSLNVDLSFLHGYLNFWFEGYGSKVVPARNGCHFGTGLSGGMVVWVVIGSG